MCVPGGRAILDVQPDAAAMSRRAAEVILETVRCKPSAILVLATGATPLAAYQIVARTADSGLFDRVRIVKLDEWCGLSMDDPATCEAYLQAHVIRPMHISPDRYVAFASDAADRQQECRRIVEWLAEHGPIDLCVLGVGVNGHVGLNEPGEALTGGPHVAALAKTTRQHAMLRAARAAVTSGYTLGMADIIGARQVLLLAAGASKAPAIRQVLSGRITTQAPASLLALHPQLTIICDAAAAAA
jgi:galactosamine-6-phosphate isomerase